MYLTVGRSYLPIREMKLEVISDCNCRRLLVSSEATDLSIYTGIFPASVWIVGFVTVAALSLGFYAIGKLTKVEVERLSIVSYMATNGLLFLQRGQNFFIASLSSKTLFLVANFLAYLVYTYYTCNLTATMTSGPPPSAIR